MCLQIKMKTIHTSVCNHHQHMQYALAHIPTLLSYRCQYFTKIQIGYSSPLSAVRYSLRYSHRYSQLPKHLSPS